MTIIRLQALVISRKKRKIIKLKEKWIQAKLRLNLIVKRGKNKSNEGAYPLIKVF